MKMLVKLKANVAELEVLVSAAHVFTCKWLDKKY